MSGAEKLAEYRRALKMQELTAAGANTPVAANLHDNIGRVLLSSGDVVGAMQHHKTALEVHERTLGPDHAACAASCQYIGQVLQKTKDFAGARQQYNRAAKIRKDKLMANHPAIAQTYTCIGMLLVAEGEYAAAMGFIKQALAMEEAVFGPSDKYTQASRDRVAKLQEYI